MIIHPELRDGEMFLTNIYINSNILSQISYKSIRVGKIAYAYNGTELPIEAGHLPVFVNKEEYELSIERTDANEGDIDQKIG
jgi:hypothetical protein